jgi:hypothetical protein
MKERIEQKLLGVSGRRIFNICLSCVLFGLLFSLLDGVFNFGVEATFFIMAPVQLFGIVLLLLWLVVQLVYGKLLVSFLYRRLLIMVLLLLVVLLILALPFCYYLEKNG